MPGPLQASVPKRELAWPKAGRQSARPTWRARRRRSFLATEKNGGLPGEKSGAKEAKKQVKIFLPHMPPLQITSLVRYAPGPWHMPDTA